MTTEITGFRTSFLGMFSEQDSTRAVSEVEIPIIQRDYAQGREGGRTSAIRDAFVGALHAALTGDSPVGLDFIYGELKDGRFEPLDGQQRLTTLFLLHWYVAARRGTLDESAAWTKFSYATRPSARLFCERIVKNPPPPDLAEAPSGWITDQSWYLHLWRFDPTISAMLVTLDAIAKRFDTEDADALWARLADAARPRIWFQLLPIGDMGGAAELYIKMNSRGKPLTEFEAFKAHLGRLVDEVGGASDFDHRIDGVWTDLFWPYRGDNDIVDDEFMRYFDFLMEVCEWREDRSRDVDITPEQRISALLDGSNPRREEHLAFICGAFDTWLRVPSIADYFAQNFRTTVDGPGLRLFRFPATSPDLFSECCNTYGAMRGSNRVFSLTDTLLLLALLHHREHAADDLHGRMRTLRNVNEASEFEVRLVNMPKLVAEVAAFMESGDLDVLVTFNTNQVADETTKRAFRAARPDLVPALERLEDHSTLRGTLTAFELDDALPARAKAFESIFQSEHYVALTGAMLATGEYQRDLPNSDQHLFGSPNTESVWRSIVARGDYAALRRTGEVLAALLDKVASSQLEPGPCLAAICETFLADREAEEHFDWRYYLVRYATMREGNTGIYYGADQQLGYQLTMLRKKTQASRYRDPYLYAIWSEAGRPTEVEDPLFSGYSTTPRWMNLNRSATGLRSVAGGIAIRPPVTGAAKPVLATLCAQVGAQQDEEGWLLPVPQRDRGGAGIDTADRVQLTAAFLKELISAGL